MSGWMQMDVLYLLFFFFTTAFVVVGASEDDFTERSVHGEIRQSTYNCSHPGFDMSCIGDEAALELPHIPIKLFVLDIDYHSQRIQVKIRPDDHGWFLMKPTLEIGNYLSNSPFRFTLAAFSQVTLLNCSGHILTLDYIENEYEIRRISGGPGYEVLAIFSNRHIANYLQLVSCSKMYDFNSQADPDDINKIMGPFSLTWSILSCPQCGEILSGSCRSKKIGAEREAKCFRRFNQTRGSSVNDSSVNEIALITGSTVGFFIVSLVVVITLFFIYTLKKNDIQSQLRIERFLEEYRTFKPSRYAYADVKKITDQFKNKLGQGAHGTVFKGKLSTDVLVAVKILNNTNGNGEEFINEVATVGQIHHVNVVRLVGYCADGFRRALVYEFLPNDSLERYISQAASRTLSYSLSWQKLQDIALGTAKGIEYLHQGCDKRILHFDIKPQNILLDQDFSPKISDFGLAKLCSKDQSIVSMSTARGTMGYIAPEVFSGDFRNVSYKSDVYSFGMLLLEMVGGRKNINATDQENIDGIYYPEWIYSLLEGDDVRIPIEEERNANIAKKLAIVGLWCIQWHPVGRPTMKVVIQMLEGERELTMPPNPFTSVGQSSTNADQPTRAAMALELEVIPE